MGQYNPSNMYRPSVAPDTQGLGPGIAAAGEAIARTIEGVGSIRSAAKAADVEFDLFQKMYPDAASMIDPDKFASSNLAGKQKMLGMGKGYVLEQSQNAQNAQANSFKDRALAQDALNSDRRHEMDAQTLGLNTQKFGLDAAQSVQASQLSAEELKLRERGMTLQELRANKTSSLMKATTPDGRFNIYHDANGNKISGLPVTENVRGPFAGGMVKEVPVDVSKFAAKTSAGRAPRVITDPTTKEQLQYDAESGSWIPLPRGGAAAANPYDQYFTP